MEPLSHPCRRILTLAAAALLVGLASTSAQARPTLAGAEADRPTLLVNGNFTRGVNGWRIRKARFTPVRNGVLGPAAGVLPRRAGSLLFRWPRPVSATEPGAVYRAVAWVRSRTQPGHRVCLRLRVVAGRKVLAVRRTCIATRSRWRRLGVVALRASCRGGQVGLSIQSPARARFDVDAVSLRRLSAPAESVTTACAAVASGKKEGASVSQQQQGLTFLNPFRAGSLWSSQLSPAPAVDPASAEKIAYWLTQIRYPNMVLRAYGTAIAVAQPGTPTLTITCTVYACPNMHQFGGVPIPAGTRADPSSDGHLAVWDPATHREWDFWISKCPADCSRAGSGTSLSTRSRSPSVPNGANAAGFPLLAGIVHPEEIGAGRIDHPLVFATPNVGTGFVCPAVHSDGKNSDPRALREGSLLQLDPTLDVGSLPIPDWQKTIARAAQAYGMYLVDGGGTLSIRAENPINRGDLWAPLGLHGNSAMFSGDFPWSRMRVLAPPRPWC